jgi:Domain of unknown function (DUF4405)
MTRIRFLFWLDVLLLLAVFVLQTPGSSGLAAHEWGGIVFGVMVALHLLVNWRWIVTALLRVTSAASWRDRVNLLLNVTLFVIVVLALFSGLMISEVVLSVAGLERSGLRAWGSLHSLFSTLSLIIVGFHIALNWDWILGVVRKRLFIRGHRDSTAGARTIGPTEKFAFASFAATLRHLAILGVIAVVVSASCFALVEVFTANQGSSVEQTQHFVFVRELTSLNGDQPESAIARLREAGAIFVREVSTALLTIGIAGFAGRTLLRFRLRADPQL